jgi:hypothetical protein
MTTRLISALFGLLFGVAALVGGADPAAAQAKKGPGGIIRLEEMVIEGRVQKPTAFFINTRDRVVYTVMELRESFVDEIPKAIDGGKF